MVYEAHHCIMPGSVADTSRLGRVLAVTDPANKTNTGTMFYKFVWLVF